MVAEVLRKALSSQEATKGMIIYLYVNGGMNSNSEAIREVTELVDELDAKVSRGDEFLRALEAVDCRFTSYKLTL